MPALSNNFERIIIQAIEKEVEKIIEEETIIATDLALVKIKKRIKQLAPLVITNLYKRMSFDYSMQEVMKITIDLKDNTTT